MIFIDTHVVVWLYSGLLKKLSTTVIDNIENNDIAVSQMVRLELQYLFEIGRITKTADEILDELAKLLGLTISNTLSREVFSNAIEQSWTRDAFDRLIVAEASAFDAILLTKDRKIREHYVNAVW